MAPSDQMKAVRHVASGKVEAIPSPRKKLNSAPGRPVAEIGLPRPVQAKNAYETLTTNERGEFRAWPATKA